MSRKSIQAEQHSRENFVENYFYVKPVRFPGWKQQPLLPGRGNGSFHKGAVPGVGGAGLGQRINQSQTKAFKYEAISPEKG